MLLKSVQKPEDFEKFISRREYWLQLHIRNAKTNLEEVRSPQTLGDKMSWCCANLRYNSSLFNKATAKDEIAKILGTSEYIIPTYQVCNSFKEIDWHNLIGKSFVIKPTNLADSKGVIVCKHKLKQQDIERLKNEVENNQNLKNRTIIIEKCILSPNAEQNFMTDYKFWCFMGQPTFCEIQQSIVKDGSFKHFSCILDTNFKKTNLQKDYTIPFAKQPRKPKNFEKMIEIATKISANMPVVRVDLYNVNGKIYFGECQKIYGYHCRFTDVNKNKELQNILDLLNLDYDISNADNRNYLIKISQDTQEAQQILHCDDDNFEFCFAKSLLPMYYISRKLDKWFIYKKHGLWHRQNNIVDITGKKTFTTDLYNKKTRLFEPLRVEKAAKVLNKISSSRVLYQYDEQGDIVYYNKYNDNECVKYIDGDWIKDEYETIKVKKNNSNTMVYNKISGKFIKKEHQLFNNVS